MKSGLKNFLVANWLFERRTARQVPEPDARRELRLFNNSAICCSFAGMLNQLDAMDRNLTILINGCHFPWADPFMIFMSEKWVWLPLYAFLIFLLFRAFSAKAFLIRLVGLGIGVAFADQTASTLLKPNVLRLRPCHDPALQSLLHLPHGCGGMYGFASSHSANAFFLAFFYFFLFRKTNQWPLALIGWASLVAYSRIYLGAHYLGDVLAGMAIGLFWAFFILKLINHRKLVLT